MSSRKVKGSEQTSSSTRHQVTTCCYSYTRKEPAGIRLGLNDAIIILPVMILDG